MPIPLLLAVDPVTLTAIGVGISALTGIGSVIASATNKPKPPAMPAPTPPATTPQGSPDTNKPAGNSFLAAAAGAPAAAQQGGKTLLGQ